MAIELNAKLGQRFEAKAIVVGERIDVRGFEPRMTSQLPVVVEAGTGLAVMIRAGAVVLFGIDADAGDRFLAELGTRVHMRFDKPEVEKASIRIGDADSVETDAIVIRELTIERIQVIAMVLAKSAVLARHEVEIARAFAAIEPLAQQMKNRPMRLPWRQRDLVRTLGETMLVEHKLVDRVELLEKPELLWESPDLDRLYAKLVDEYELRERYGTLDTKLGVILRAAQTMLELSQTKRALQVEYYIVGLIVFEIALSLLR